MNMIKSYQKPAKGLPIKDIREKKPERNQRKPDEGDQTHMNIQTFVKKF